MALSNSTQIPAIQTHLFLYSHYSAELTHIPTFDKEQHFKYLDPTRPNYWHDIASWIKKPTLSKAISSSYNFLLLFFLSLPALVPVLISPAGILVFFQSHLACSFLVRYKPDTPAPSNFDCQMYWVSSQKSPELKAVWSCIWREGVQRMEQAVLSGANH